MATMKLYELVNHYHIGTELTCAEAMFMACNEYYHLNLSEETRKMFSVMGLGMQTEHSCCGAFTVAVGIIGLMTAKEGQTDVSNMEGYQMIAELTEFMLGFYGTLHCVELQRLEIVGYENPCHAIVEALAKKLEELLANRRIFCPANGGPVSYTHLLSAFFAEMTEWEQYMEQAGFEDAQAVPRLLAIWEKYVSEKPRPGYRPLGLSYSAQGTYNGEEFLDAEQITKNKLYIYTREKNTGFDRRFLMKRVGEGWMIDAVQERLNGWQRSEL